jgi:DNA repair ATPase RecN
VLTQVEVENFQSLRRLSIALGRFTVVTGATGSGKSALLRAVRRLALNGRGGAECVSRGAKCLKVGTGDQEQGWFAGLERHAKGSAKDCYRLVHAPQSGDEPHVETFTKLNGEVPGDIQNALQITELNFAGQFDRPFLLDSSGGEVARVLGRLTNVTLLFDAAREAERRRREILGDLKRAEENLADLAEQAQRFKGMKERRQAVVAAEEALERWHGLDARIGRLRVLTERLEIAEAALGRAVPPEVPDISRLEEITARLDRARSLYRQLDEALMAADGAQFAAEQAHTTLRAAEERLHEVLAEAGQCPVCGQEVKPEVTAA